MLTLPVWFFLSLSSCGKSGRETTGNEEEVLLVAGDSVLYLRDVELRIPEGIDATDSAALFQRIVSGWIEGIVLSRLAAEKLPDSDEIDRRVEEYRNRLIVAEYLRMMEASRSMAVPSDSVKKFYRDHKSEMVTEVPLVKGILLKLPEGAPGIERIRTLISNPTGENLDELDRQWATEALRYDYFLDRWIDWQVVAEQIPYRFYDSDAFLSSSKDFETSYNGSVYFMHISDYLPSGSPMPEEFAYAKIQSMMDRAKISDYESALVESLVKKAVKDGNLKGVGYDPLTGTMTGEKTHKTTTN